MNSTQKAILTITALLLTVLLFIIFGKVFKFERYKPKTEEIVDEQVINELYSYLPNSNDYEIDAIYYGHYASFNTLTASTIEQMIVNYLLNYEKDRVEYINTYNLDEKLLYKISQENMTYGLKRLFGDDKSYNFRDVRIDYQTKLVYKDNYIYAYQENTNLENDNIIYRYIIKYSSGDDDTIKIYDYYLKCDKYTNECYEDEKKSVKSKITYKQDLNVNDYINELAQYEHIFKKNNDHYYWVSSSKK